MMLIYLLTISIIAGLCTGYTIVTLQKWQVFEYYDALKPRWLGETCYHCISFWLSIPFIIVLIFGSGVRPELIYIIAPIASASVAKWSNNYK